jgi:hypothetical protein
VDIGDNVLSTACSTDTEISHCVKNEDFYVTLNERSLFRQIVVIPLVFTLDALGASGADAKEQRCS